MFSLNSVALLPPSSARSDYVAIGPDGKKLTSSTGANPWRHKDGKVKTHYSFNKITGKVDSRVYDGEGTCLHFRSVSHYINTIFAINIKTDFVAA
jgi:hypothetical protein